MIHIQYLCRLGPNAGQWIDAPSAPTFEASPEAVHEAALWCRDIYASMDAITWAYAPDLRVVARLADDYTMEVPLREFYAVKQTPRVYA